MNILVALRKQEKILLLKMAKIEHQTSSIRAAIHALANGNGRKQHQVTTNGYHKKKRKMTAAHRAAIKAGWAKRKRKMAKKTA
jgi:hypothetical protein